MYQRTRPIRTESLRAAAVRISMSGVFWRRRSSPGYFLEPHTRNPCETAAPGPLISPEQSTSTSANSSERSFDCLSVRHMTSPAVMKMVAVAPLAAWRRRRGKQYWRQPRGDRQHLCSSQKEATAGRPAGQALTATRPYPLRRHRPIVDFECEGASLPGAPDRF